MDKKEQTRLRVKRYRERNSVTKIPDNVTQSPEGVTETADSVTLDVTQYHPVMEWLIPGERRDKLEKIVESAKRFNQLHNIYLGAGRHALPLDIVSEMLEVTQC